MEPRTVFSPWSTSWFNFDPYPLRAPYISKTASLQNPSLQEAQKIMSKTTSYATSAGAPAPRSLDRKEAIMRLAVKARDAYAARNDLHEMLAPEGHLVP